MSIMKRKTFKETAYRLLSKWGIRTFQKVFPEYFAKEPLAPSDRYIEYPFVIKNLPKPPAKILDVGCAGSYFPLLLAGFGYEVWGTDLREYAIINKIKFDNFSFVKGDIRRTTFADNYFDAVTTISTIEHIGISGRYGEKEDLDGDRKAMEEMRRISKPAGIIILTIPFGKAKIIRPFSRIYDEALINQLVQGFEIIKEEYYYQDSGDDWIRCAKNDVFLVDATPDRYPLCLLLLKNKK